jgi:hypothetical protein
MTVIMSGMVVLMESHVNSELRELASQPFNSTTVGCLADPQEDVLTHLGNVSSVKRHFVLKQAALFVGVKVFDLLLLRPGPETWDKHGITHCWFGRL